MQQPLTELERMNMIIWLLNDLYGAKNETACTQQLPIGLAKES